MSLQVLIECGAIVMGKPEVDIQRWNADWSEKFDAEGNLIEDGSKAKVDTFVAAFAKFAATWKAGVAAVGGAK